MYVYTLNNLHMIINGPNRYGVSKIDGHAHSAGIQIATFIGSALCHWKQLVVGYGPSVDPSKVAVLVRLEDPKSVG